MPEEQEQGKPPPKKSRRMILILGVAAVLVIGLGAGWGFLRPSGETEPDAEHGTAPEIKAVLHLESFVVNLADPDENRFLRVGIDLGLEHDLGGGGHGQKSSPPIAAMRDAILGVLTTWKSEALMVPEGKTKLKEELAHALQKRLPELGVREVYYTDFVVQR